MSPTPSMGRRDALDALRSSEAQYRRLFETAQDGILILNAQTGLMTDVNPFLIRLLDYSREDFIGKTLWDIGAFSKFKNRRQRFENYKSKSISGMRICHSKLEVGGGLTSSL